MEVPPRCQLNALSWKDAKLSKLHLNHFKLLYIVLNCYNLLYRFKISKFGSNSFGLWGWAGFFWVWTGLLPALTQKMDQQLNQHRITILITIWFTDHIICVCQQSLPDWERWCIIIGLPACTMGLSTVPLACQMSQKCASMPEGHPWSVWASLDGYRCPRCPEGLDIVPLCQMAVAVQVPQRLYSWFSLFA